MHVKRITTLRSRFTVCHPLLYADLQLLCVFLVRSEGLMRQDKNHTRRYNSTKNTHSINLKGKLASTGKEEKLSPRECTCLRGDSHATGLEAQNAGVI